MRTRSTITFRLLAAFLLASSPTRLTAQVQQTWSPGKYLAQAVARVYGTVLAAQRLDADVGFDDGIALGVSLVRRRESTTLVRTLTAGETYYFIGAGDDDVSDVDIEVTDSRGRPLASDRLDDASPVVEFTPRYSGRYRITLSLPRSARDAFLALAMLRRGGWSVPADNMVIATRKLVAVGAALSESGASGFLHEGNQWGVWGGVVAGDDAYELTDVTLGTGHRVLLAASDSPDGDIDLVVARSNGDLEGADEDAAADAVVRLQTSRTRRYRLTTRNAGSGARFVMTGVLIYERSSAGWRVAP